MIPGAVQLRPIRSQKENLRAYFAKSLERASVFVTASECRDDGATEVVADLKGYLSQRFPVTVCEVVLPGFPAEIATIDGASTRITGFVVQDISGELLKRVLEAYFLARLPREVQDTSRIKLSSLGHLFPMDSEIVCYSFAHGVGHYYRYRLAKNKLTRIDADLTAFLLKLSVVCPNDRFMTGPRASGFERPVTVEMEHQSEHACITFARRALEHRRFKSAHEDVEKFMVENDYGCIASEIPIWLEAEEMRAIGLEWTDTSGWLTGHIDILRCEEDGAIWIWDYKPEARLETTAHIQVYLYAVMLSKRTGIPLATFRCGYFDANDAYFFTASDARANFAG